MPQPHATSSANTGYNMNSQSTGMPAGVPFGAGWIAPTQHPQHQQHQQQQQQSNMAPYPTTQNHAAAPYPTGHNGAGAAAAAPYPTSTPYPHTAPYPSNQPPYPPGGNYGSPYPGSSYPHNPQQSSYPSSSSPSLHSYHNAHYNNTIPSHPTSYNPQHGYTPVRTSSGLESPAGNIQHCFEELAQRQGHPIQHHLMQRKEVSVFAKENQKKSFFLFSYTKKLLQKQHFFCTLLQIKINFKNFFPSKYLLIQVGVFGLPL